MSLQIRIETIIHCAACRVTEEYFKNAAADEFSRHDAVNRFEDAAVDHFRCLGWQRHPSNDEWYCRHHACRCGVNYGSVHSVFCPQNTAKKEAA